MKYFYCQSYQAFNQALSLGRDVTIITYLTDIIEACKSLKVDCLEVRSFNDMDLICRYRDVNQEIKRIADVVGNNEFHFSHTQFATFCFVVLSRLVFMKKRIVFYNFEYIHHRLIFANSLNKRGISKFLKALVIGVIYRIPLELRTAGRHSFISLKQSYIDKNCKIIDNKSDYYQSMIKFFKEVNIKSKRIPALFVHQILDKKYNDRCFAVLKYLNSKSVTIKTHPNYQLKGQFDKCEILPSFIPVEYYYNNVTNCVISFYSYALVAASQWANIQAISLIDFLGDNDYYKGIKQDLNKKSNGKITFLSTVEELDAILNRI